MITKTGILLLNEKDITSLIKTIESHLTGWWYSISQKKGVVRVSVGPDRSCSLLDTDRALALTKEGDKGYLFDFVLQPYTSDYDQILISKIDETIRPARDAVSSQTTTYPERTKTHRQHDRNQRHAFRKKYRQFLSEISEVESRGFHLNEIYIGSCHLSSDVSLRGVNIKGNKPFDISYDLLHDNMLCESLDEAVTDFRLLGMRMH